MSPAFFISTHFSCDKITHVDKITHMRIYLKGVSMKNVNVAYAAMGFVLLWTIILAVYHVRIKELEVGKFVEKVSETTDLAVKKKSIW